MPFRPIAQERVATSVSRQIESLILRGVLRPGERLPSERDMAAEMGVSRPSVREALAELEREGLVETRPGAGAFVAEVLGSAFAPPLVRLFATHPEALFDYLSFRRDLEMMAAGRAAREASGTDLDVIHAIFSKMEAAHEKRSSREEAELDVEFHMAIIEASHNVVMLHMMRSMFGLLKEGVFYNRQTLFSLRPTRRDLLDQHRAINDALQARDDVGARTAVAAHLDFVRDAMEEQLRRTANEETAKLRFEHELRRS
ncbi:FadR/GntR family transcriptional regulator [Algicella marina]|uniref:Pyruvate dehydrogenase complex repressor n=1 Tax=Algicella marina TaxID=2683284 RepID=A0A6P1T2T4_9RHOB|nr:FCD domain-containing protein [Algicella marina]QHQ35973.1 FCD domain-containing protein [Algicella marina]